MRTATVVSALAGFLPSVWLSLCATGLAAFIVLRPIFVGWRTISGHWIVTGT